MPDEQELEQGGVQPLVSPLDPDFLLAFFFAGVIDILDFALELGTLVNLIGGGLLVWWIASKGGEAPGAQEVRQHQTQRQAAKKVARSALRKGIRIFVLELIPLLNLFPFWTIAVLSLLRQREAPPQEQSLSPL